MKDSVLQITVAGIVGAIIMDVSIYLIRLFGFQVTAPWHVAADVFLTSKYINTTSGVILGLIGTLALNIAGALAIYLLIKITGYDYAVLKGILAINAFSFITMGLFMPMLKIAPQVQIQPFTNFMALLILTLVGIAMAQVLKRFRVSEERNG